MWMSNVSFPFSNLSSRIYQPLSIRQLRWPSLKGNRPTTTNLFFDFDSSRTVRSWMCRRQDCRFQILQRVLSRSLPKGNYDNLITKFMSNGHTTQKCLSLVKDILRKQLKHDIQRHHLCWIAGDISDGHETFFFFEGMMVSWELRIGDPRGIIVETNFKDHFLHISTWPKKERSCD